MAAKLTPRQKDIHFVVDLVKAQASSLFRLTALTVAEDCMGNNAVKFWVVPRKTTIRPDRLLAYRDFYLGGKYDRQVFGD